MTTIATDGKSMAGDGQACVESMVTTFDRVKVHRLPDGALLGCAGDSGEIIAFRKWLVEGGKHPRLKELSALLLRTDGVLLYYCEFEEPSVMSIPAAIGSGRAIAIGAMEAGASPERAVEIAAKRDTGTGGMITALHLDP